MHYHFHPMRVLTNVFLHQLIECAKGSDSLAPSPGTFIWHAAKSLHPLLPCFMTLRLTQEKPYIRYAESFSQSLLSQELLLGSRPPPPESASYGRVLSVIGYGWSLGRRVARAASITFSARSNVLSPGEHRVLHRTHRLWEYSRYTRMDI